MSAEPPSSDPSPGAPGDAARNPTELWHRYQLRGPGDTSEEELVKRYLPLVKTVVGRLAMTLPPHVDTEDLYSAGLVGLLNAVRHFNPKLGTAFEPYARLRIRGAVLDELRRMDWVPRSVHAKARKVQAVLERLEQRLGRVPTDEEMAAGSNLSLDDYHRLLDEIRPVTFVCLDAASSAEGEEDQPDHETVSDVNQADPVDKVSQAELGRLIAERIEHLPEMQKKVLALYYFEDLRLREIAEACGLCESRICQIHTQAILAIRSYVEQCEAFQRKAA
jgi:RNA polymerase sigma factor for flagellar operon FliA